jgi:hypothetical protein
MKVSASKEIDIRINVVLEKKIRHVQSINKKASQQ